MNIEIRQFLSTDTRSVPLADYVPADAGNVGLLVTAVIGVKEEPGEDNFDIMVCTPKWLAGYVSDRPNTHLFGRHYLIVDKWDYEMVRSIIYRLVETTGGDNWDEFGRRLDRYMHWEFGSP